MLFGTIDTDAKDGMKELNERVSPETFSRGKEKKRKSRCSGDVFKNLGVRSMGRGYTIRCTLAAGPGKLFK